MSEKESHDAAQEAMAETLRRPDHSPEPEEALLRYLGGVAYHEEREDSREQAKLPKEGEKQ